MAAAGSVRWVDRAPTALVDEDTAAHPVFTTTVTTTSSAPEPLPVPAAPVAARPAPKAVVTSAHRSVGQSSSRSRLNRAAGWQAMARDNAESPEVARSQLQARLDQADADLREGRDQTQARALKSERDQLSHRVSGASDPATLSEPVESLCLRAAQLRTRAETGAQRQ